MYITSLLAEAFFGLDIIVVQKVMKFFLSKMCEILCLFVVSATSVLFPLQSPFIILHDPCFQG